MEACLVRHSNFIEYSSAKPKIEGSKTIESGNFISDIEDDFKEYPSSFASLGKWTQPKLIEKIYLDEIVKYAEGWVNCYLIP